MGRLQIIRSPAGEEMVVIPRAEYEALLAAAEAADEEAEDQAMYDARKAELAAGRDGVLPEAVSRLLLKSNSRLKAVRLWRGMTQTGLAKAAGIGQGYLSDMESGRRPVTAEALSALSAKLDVPPEWIG